MPEDLSHLLPQLIEEWLAMVNVEVEVKEIVEDVYVVMSTEDTNVHLPRLGRAIIFRFEFRELIMQRGVSQGSVLSLMRRGPSPDDISMHLLAGNDLQD